MSTLSKTQKGTKAQESGVQPDPSPYEQIAFDFCNPFDYSSIKFFFFFFSNLKASRLIIDI